MTTRDNLRKLAPIIGVGRTNQLWRAYLAGDATDRRELETAIEAYAAHLLRDSPSSSPPGLFPPPPAVQSVGDIPLGHVRYASQNMHAFGLRRDEMLRHVGVYGSSGCGKSNAIALIIDGLARLQVPFLLVDFKRTFRALLTSMPDLTVFTAGDRTVAPFAFNPLIPPPGTSIEVWGKKVIGALSHAYCQGAGSESLLATALPQAYQHARTQSRWPTFIDVAEILETEPARGRKGMWLDSARRAATSLSTENQQHVFCPNTSIDIAQLLRRNVVLEMDLLSQAEQTFLSEVLLLWAIQYRLNERAPRESLKHAFIIEEAHHLLRSPPGIGDGSEPVVHIALREIRELGESVILATQNASVVPTAVFGNQATTLAFHTKHAKDVSSTAQAMLLKDEAKDEIGRLPVGEAIVRIPRWPDPIHISLNYRPIAKGTVSDAQIRGHAAKQADSMNTGSFHPTPGKPTTNSAIPRTDDEDTYSAESLSTHAASPTKAASPTTTPANQTHEPAPTQLELTMLQDILEHPYDGVVKRIKRIQTSRRKGTAALHTLEKRGTIKSANIFTGTSLIKLFDLTKDGLALCQDNNLGPVPKPTEGGIEHRYWVHATARTLRANGWNVKMEHSIARDLTMDIHAEKDTQCVGILVETGKSNVKENLAKTAEAGYKKIWVVSQNSQVAAIVNKVRAESYPAHDIRIMAGHEVYQGRLHDT